MFALGSVNKGRFFVGFKYSLLAGFGLFIIIMSVLLIIGIEPRNLPIGLVTMLIGGLFITITGCVGPGRYKKEYDLLIYEPRPGSSFSKSIPVSGFTMKDDIQEANIIVNNHSVGILKFVNGQAKTEIQRRDIVQQSVNHIWLDYDGTESNKNYFTTFDYQSDMSDEEIDELLAIESEEPEKPLEEVVVSYKDQMNRGIGSVALGIGFTAAIFFTIGVIVDLLVSNIST